MFFVTYVLFETPWAMSVKRFGLNKVLAVAFLSWGAITIGTGFIQNYAQGMACRLLLGAAEAGVAPCISFFISTVYSREKQGKRMAIIYLSAAISGSLGGLIAYGIQTMGYRHGLEAWRWLFIIEGIVTLVVCGICWFSLPKSAEEAWFLNAEEKYLMQLRKRRDAAYKGQDKFEWRYFRMAATDPAVWIASMALFGAGVCLFGFATFLPTILRGMGYTSLEANYLSIPVYAWACICVVFFTWLSDKLVKRAMVMAMVPLPVICGYAIAIGTPSHGAGYFAMFLCAVLYSYNTLLVTWIANNIKPDHKRSVGLALLFSFANISGAVAGQIYPPRTSPRYIMGNAISLGMEFMALSGVGVLYLLFRQRDAQKQKLLTSGQEENGKEGDRAMDFRYIL